MTFTLKKIFSLAVIPAVVLSSSLFAKSPTSTKTIEVPSGETPSLNVGDGVSDRIYQRSTATITSSSNGTLAMESSFRVFFPKRFELKNDYFTVPYDINTSSVLGFTVGPKIPLTTLGSSRLSSFSYIGFAYAQGIYNVQSDTGLAVRDAVELQWIPIQTGLEWASSPLTSARMVFGLMASGGMDWYTQSGQLNGMNQTFWVPRSEAGVSLTLFPAEQAGKGGFDGVRLSAMAYRSFASTQINRGSVVDLGARYAF